MLNKINSLKYEIEKTSKKNTKQNYKIQDLII
jgi:hypothetical protein